VPNQAIDITLQPAHPSSTELPGDFAIWFFIFAELTVFAIFFIGFAWMDSRNPEMFDAGKATLHPIAGLINTLALISSSYILALAIQAAKKGDGIACRNGFWLSIAIASIYVVSKMWEYDQLIEQGYNLSSNNFYMFYFFTTGFHFMHVLLGMVILAILAVCLNKPDYVTSELSTLESGASYWHMVDLLWLILFPLVYVI
jgi:nitric oxide reductase NorE protein